MFLWLDVRLFRAINGFAGGPLDQIGIFIGTLLVLASVAFTFVPLVQRQGFGRTLRTLGAGAVALFIAEIIKMIVHRPRPFVALGDVHLLISKDAAEWSFPSSHASVAFAIAFALYAFDKRLGRAAFVIAILVGLGRIFVGVHYPSDILGGAIFGYAAAYVIAKKR